MKLSVEGGWIGQTSCWSGWDWSNFVRSGLFGQTSCWSGRDWSNILWECARLDKLFVGGGRIGQRILQDESRVSVGAIVIGNSFGSRQDWGKHSPVHNAT